MKLLFFKAAGSPADNIRRRAEYFARCDWSSLMTEFRAALPTDASLSFNVVQGTANSHTDNIVFGPGPRPADSTSPTPVPAELPLPRHLRALGGHCPTALDERQVTRVEAHLRNGEVARAAAALVSSPIAPVSTARDAALRALYPPKPIDTPPPSAHTVEDVSLRTLRRTLFSFSRGSAPGPEGMSPATALSVLNIGNVSEVMRTYVTTLLRGAEPAHYHSKGTALMKESLSPELKLRPLGAGSVWRRTAAKIGVQRTLPAALPTLQRVGQLGVGVKGGVEALAHALHRYTSHALGSPSPVVLVRLDLTNAFNETLRGAFLADDVLAPLQPYLRAAYGSASTIHYRQLSISATAGFDQGCPAAPLAFSTTLARVMPPSDALEFMAWDLDDGVVGGTPQAVDEFLTRLEPALASVGLSLNRTKSCVLPNDVATAQIAEHPLLSQLTPGNLRDFCHVGCHFGTVENIISRTRLAAQKAADTHTALMTLPNHHMAFTLLKFTASQGLVNYSARITPVDPEVFAAFDRSLEAHASALLGVDADPQTVRRMFLPQRLGGCSLRRASDFADIAFAASALASQDHFASICSLQLPPHPHLGQALARIDAFTPAASLIRGRFFDEARAQHRASGLQRKLQQLRDSTLADNLLAELPARQAAHMKSCRSDFAMSYLAPIARPDLLNFNWFMDNSAFTLEARRLFAQPLHNVPQACVLCQRDTADVYGDHALCCSRGGWIARRHFRVVELLLSLSSACLWNPLPEPACFPAEPRRRADVLLRHHNIAGLPACVDVAITHALGNPSVVLTAASTYAAANAYEEMKRRSYGTLPRDSGVTLVPMVADTCGGWSDAARSLLRNLSRAFATRHDLHFSHAYQMVMAMFRVQLARAVAAQLAVQQC